MQLYTNFHRATALPCLDCIDQIGSHNLQKVPDGNKVPFANDRLTCFMAISSDSKDSLYKMGGHPSTNWPCQALLSAKFL